MKTMILIAVTLAATCSSVFAQNVEIRRQRAVDARSLKGGRIMADAMTARLSLPREERARLEAQDLARDAYSGWIKTLKPGAAAKMTDANAKRNGERIAKKNKLNKIDTDTFVTEFVNICRSNRAAAGK